MNDPVAGKNLLIWLLDVAVLSDLIRVHHVSYAGLGALSGLLWLDIVVLGWALVWVLAKAHLDKDIGLDSMDT